MTKEISTEIKSDPSYAVKSIKVPRVKKLLKKKNLRLAFLVKEILNNDRFF